MIDPHTLKVLFLMIVGTFVVSAIITGLVARYNSGGNDGN